MLANFKTFGVVAPPREFNSLTHIELFEKFVAAWLKGNPNKENAEEIAVKTAELFILGLGSYGYPEFFTDRSAQLEGTQRRREKLRAFVNALSALMIAAEKLEIMDLDGAIAAGISAAAPAAPDLPRYHKALSGLSSEEGRVSAGEQIFRLLNPPFGYCDHEALSRFLRGISLFADSGELEPRLPPPVSDFAYDLVKFLDQQNIPVSTTSTGLAGLAFESTFDLAGLPAAKTSYWLRKAKDAWGAEKAKEEARRALLSPEERALEDWRSTPEGHAADQAALKKRLRELSSQNTQTENVISWGV